MSASKQILLAEHRANDFEMTLAGQVPPFDPAVKKPGHFRAVIHAPPPGCAPRP